MRWVHVESSAIAALAYDERRKILGVRFPTGSEYHYLGVPPRVHRELMRAESKGHFYAARVRDSYPFERIE